MRGRDRANEVDELIRALRSRSDHRVNEARTRLTMLAAHAVDPLIETLTAADAKSTDNKVRARIIALLALIQDPRGREPIAAMLTQRSWKVRERAARALARFPGNDSIQALVGLLARERRAVVRAAAVSALVELYSAGHQGGLRTVLAVLMDTAEPAEARIAALHLLRDLSLSQRDPFLARLASDEDPEVQCYALGLRSELTAGPSSSTLRGEVEALASDHYADWNRAVRKLIRRGTRAVPTLIEAMRSRAHNPEFCNRAGMVLRGLGPRRMHPVIDALEVVEEPLPLQVLVEVIGASDYAPAVYRLEQLIDRLARWDSDPTEWTGSGALDRVRALAHLELAKRGSRVAIEDLRRILEDPDRRVDPSALAAVERIGSRAEIGTLLQIYPREDPWSQALIADAVLAILSREKIRRNHPMFRELGRAQKRALATILPPLSPRPARRRSADRRAAGRSD